MDDHQRQLDQRIQEYYARDFDEAARITTRSVGGRIEHQRVVDLVTAQLSPASRVLDVGGATGTHARWLAEAGHEVVLVDPVPEQVAVASGAGTFAAEVGDARTLRFPDASFDAVLVFGPLYHLHARADRVRALQEAARVVTPGGVVLAQGISRLAAFGDAVLARQYAPTASDIEIVTTGEWSTTGEGFPGGHFHSPDELADEVAAAGLAVDQVTGVEAPTLGGLEWIAEDEELERLGLALARRMAELLDRPSPTRRHDATQLAALSAHILVVGRRPA